MSYTHITSIWSEEYSLLGQRWRKSGLFGVKKKFFPPAAGTLIGNLLERRAGLRRPTASGLNCDRRTPPWHDLYLHHVYLIWSGLSFKSEIMKNSVFWNLLSDSPKRQFVSYHFGDEPNRCRHFWTPSIALLGAPWHALYSHHVYLVWRVLIIGSEMTVIWVKKKNPPAAGTLIGNLLKRRAGLRRPTVSGLNYGRGTHFKQFQCCV